MTTRWESEKNVHRFYYVSQAGKTLVATATEVGPEPWRCAEVKWVLPSNNNRAYETLEHAMHDVERQFP